jgi:hypothetical protein
LTVALFSSVASTATTFAQTEPQSNQSGSRFAQQTVDNLIWCNLATSSTSRPIAVRSAVSGSVGGGQDGLYSPSAEGRDRGYPGWIPSCVAVKPPFRGAVGFLAVKTTQQRARIHFRPISPHELTSAFRGAYFQRRAILARSLRGRSLAVQYPRVPASQTIVSRRFPASGKGVHEA